MSSRARSPRPSDARGLTPWPCTPRSPRSSPPCRHRRRSARPGGHARRRGRRRSRRSRAPAARTVEDADRADAVGRGAGAGLHAGRGRRVRPAGLLPRRRVLPRQPGHARPRRAVAGEGDRAQGHLRRLPPGPRGGLSRPACRTATASFAGPRRTATACAGTATTLAIAGDSSGGTFVAAVAATGPRRRVRPHHAPGPVLPLARPGLRRRPLRLAARERRRATASRRPG